MSRITESEVAFTVEQILADCPNGEATIKQLVREIPNRIVLSDDDLKPSLTRPNEAIWEQQVRNITSHKSSPGNAIYEGRLISVRGGLKLARNAIAA